MSTPANLPIGQNHFESRQRLVQKLKGKIRCVETIGRNDDGTVISSGSHDIDNMLPAGGYNRGTIIEWIADNGSSADFLSLLAAKNAAADGGAIVIIDRHSQFFPPAAKALGINLGNLIVLRGDRLTSVNKTNNTHNRNSLTQEDFLWSIDQSLRCSAVAAVWGELPEFENSQTKTRWLRRFQLSAESSGCCGMFLKPVAVSKNSDRSSFKVQRNKSKELSTKSSFNSWAEIQWQIVPTGSTDSKATTRKFKAILTRCRGGVVGRTIDLEINTITGNVQKARREYATSNNNSPARALPLASQLANSKTGRRTARA